MAYLGALGRYVPQRVVDNAELSARTGADAAWILDVTGMRERRYAAPDETVAQMGVAAARQCLEGAPSARVGLVLAASGTAERRFPGPASEISTQLGLGEVPAIDLPVASAGSLFAMALAADLCPRYGDVLVVASETMSRAIGSERETAILFGDGAGACLVSADTGFARIADSVIASDGAFAGALGLEYGSTLQMDGRTIILQASRKMPRAITELLERNRLQPDDVGAYILHQANLNLIARVARVLRQSEEKFFVNLDRYGNTSSASLLIAAADWRCACSHPEKPVVLSAFGAGIHWGALLLLPSAVQ